MQQFGEGIEGTKLGTDLVMRRGLILVHIVFQKDAILARFIGSDLF